MKRQRAVSVLLAYLAFLMLSRPGLVSSRPRLVQTSSRPDLGGKRKAQVAPLRAWLEQCLLQVIDQSGLMDPSPEILMRTCNFQLSKY